MSEIVKDFIKAVKEEKQGTSPYDTPATVTRVDGDTAWVHIAGGVDETPVKLTVNANVGDNVQVRVGGGRAWITGNATAPPTDDTKANVAHGVALKAEDTATAAQIEAVRAKAAADEAEAMAEAVHDIAEQAQQDAETASTNAQTAITQAQNATAAAQQAQNSLKSVVQGATTVEKAVSVMQTALEAVVDYDAQNDTVQEYFWHDANGAHVLGDTSGYRNDTTSTGMKIVDVSDEEVVSEFSADGATIGKSDGSQSYLYEDYHSLQMIDKDGNTYLHISNLLDKNGLMNDVFYADGSTTKFVLAVTAKNIGSATYNVYVDDALITSGVTKTLYDITFSVAPTNGSVVRVSYEPSNSHNINAYTLGLRKSGTAIGKLSFVEGENNKASASNAHAEGENTSAYTDSSHAEGLNTSAGGERTNTAAHAEGKNTSAYGTGAHAEGINTHASGYASHAEGSNTKTFNPSNGYAAYYAHAEGINSVVCSDCSHASGLGTNAYRAIQTVIGKYNEIDTYAGDAYDGTPSYDDDIVHRRYGENVFIIGNGTDDNNRSNALTVDWSGNVEAKGDITDGSGNMLSDKADTSSVPTKTSDLTNDSNFVGFESGTATAGSVTWKYRKWANGELEMWGSGSTTLAINTASGNIYTTANEYDVAVPSFVDSVDFLTGEISGGGWVDVTGFNVPPKVRFYAPTAYGSTTRYLRYYLKGSWS